jgi:low temperature requirement protein LtrA
MSRVDRLPLTTDAQQEDDEHEVTPLELFFDLALVFAVTQVTSLLVHNPTWGGVLRGMLVLAALWWAWSGYSWLTSAVDVDEGSVRLAMLAAMAAMLVVALAVPDAFGDDGVLFGVAYLVVRLLHLVLYAVVGRGDHHLRRALRDVAPAAIGAGVLLIAAGFVDGDVRLLIWFVAVGLDYVAPLASHLRGWTFAPEHFAERHGLVMLVALGESVIAIGVGVGHDLDAGIIAAAVLGMIVIFALWWLYFDVAAIFARRRLCELEGVDQTRLGLYAYSYLHLPMVAGIVVFAFGLETALHQLDTPLELVPAVALCAGVVLFLAGQIGFLVLATHRVFRRRSLAAMVLLAVIPLALSVPAFVALAVVSAVTAGVVVYEVVGRRDARNRIRHPEHEDAS